MAWSGDAGDVRLAGDFTGWQAGALPLARGGDGVYRRTVGPADGLVPGQLHAYKLIVDGRWIIDPGARLRKYDGNCVNGGLHAPACDQGPLLVGAPVEADAAGAWQASVQALRAQDEAPLAQVTLTLDGAPVAAEVDAARGRFTAHGAGLAPGRHVLRAHAQDAEGRDAEAVDLVFWVEDAPHDWRDGALYLLFLDRFANGEPANDAPVGPPVTYPADWHGGDLQGALAVLESGYFERLGVGTIWLSPVNTQVEGHFAERGGGDRRIAPYHGYWPVRGRQVDPRLGGDDALRAFVEAAHARGIRVLLDLINNQVHEQHEYVGPHPDWFRTACVCGLDPGCGWSERPLDCLFAPYLPDINWRVAGAEQQFISDAVWWIETFGVDGFRVDAVKHVETTSIYNLRDAVARRFEQGGTRVVMLGETAVGEGDRFDDGCGEQFGDGYAWISAYTGPAGLDGQFDFPTHHRIQWGLLTGNAPFGDIEGAISTYERRYGPDALHVQFLGSHDSSRMASRAASDPAGGCRFADEPGCDLLPGQPADAGVYQRLRRAFTLLYTLPGLPLLYYGDDVALPGGNDPDSRRDMPWTGDLADLAMTADVPSPAQLDLRRHIEALGAARLATPALTRGARVPLVVEPDLYVYARYDDEDVALVVLNRGGAVADRVVGLGALAGPAAWAVVVGEAQVQGAGDGVRLSLPAGGQAVIAARR
ncbi:MAG: hypothetical protein H6706_25240 [Myxococcales bacterium]|nr:hypothetical protein [Myxococcales bacterium]